MFKKKAFVAIAVLGLGAGTASADGPLPSLPLPVYGSDTLFNVTTKLIADCEAAGHIPSGTLSYKGTGSGQGGKAMGAGDSTTSPVIPAHNQQLAPQSRFLSSGECSAISTNQGNGIVIGLDGIAVLAATANNTGCDNVRSTDGGSPLPSYTFSDWRDVLRLLYAGQPGHVSADPCSPNDPPKVPGTPAQVAGNCGNGALDIGEQCDDGNTSNFDGCSSGCLFEITNANRCNSPARAALIANWGAMFEGGCGNASCTKLRHAFRRDDVSGTTDTFLTLLGLPGITPIATARPFCNGQDNEDLDPQRTACDTNEQVCTNIPYANRWTGGSCSAAAKNGGAPTNCVMVDNAAAGNAGDLGVVLAVTMPTDTTKQYQAFCNAAIGGAFKLAPMPFVALLEAQKCPDGNGRQGGQCRYPVNTAGQFCLARIGNRPAGRTLVNMDARAYNLIPRDPIAGTILLPNAAGVGDPRWGGGGWYKLHQTAAMANGTGTCNRVDATDQLGCLVISDPCSISYAGREGIQTGNKALLLRTPADSTYAGPTVADITKLLNPAGGATCANGGSDDYGHRYSLARKLYINSSKGVANIVNDVTASDGSTLTTHELDFYSCVADKANGIADGAINAFHFITIPDSTYPTRSCP